MEHRVLPRDLVGDDRHVDRSTNRPHHVEVRHPRLDDHGIGAFLDITPRLALRLPHIGGVHLIAEPIAALRRGSRSLAERPVEGRRVFDRVGDDRRVGAAGLIE